MTQQITKSVLVKSRFKKVVKENFRIDGGQGKLVVYLRYDDQCGNGHNTFSITADLYRDGRQWEAGCLNENIERFAPELAYLIKWHLCSSDGPLHYIDNTTYHAKHSNIEAARRCAIWPDATLGQLLSEEALTARLPDLLTEFKQAMQSIGFTY